MNSESSRPSLRWSCSRACSSRAMCASSSSLDRNAVPYTRVSICRLGVAAPVGAGHAGELERLDALGAGAVRAAAEVGEGAVAVERDGLHAVGGDEILDQLDLVVLPLGTKALDRLGHGKLAALEGLVGGDVLAHLRLDALEVVLGQLHALGELEVVVEAVLDRRADGDLHPRIELQDRGGQHVGGVVADQPEGVGRVAAGHDLDPGPVGKGGAQVAQFGVAAVEAHPDSQGGAGEPGADGAGGVRAGGPVGKLQGRAVGEVDGQGFGNRSVRLCHPWDGGIG